LSESDQLSTYESFASEAGRQLGLYAVFAIFLLGIVIYGLSFVVTLTGGGVSGKAIDFENNSITISVAYDPPQLDSMRATDASSFLVLAHVLEGLISNDEDNNLAPGVAERWEIREDGATFWLRDDAMWSDGQAVTAHDFEFAWKRVVDPKTASEYAFLLFPVENAEAITEGQMPASSLGVFAVSDRELRVKFERPTPYFEKLVAFVTYFPAREDFVNSTDGRYASSAETMLYNGPYTVDEWVLGASMKWSKNPHYWNEKKGFLDEINVAYITTDVNAKLNLFKDGQITDTALSASMLPEAMERRWQIDRLMDGTVFFMEFNHRDGRLTNNRNFRKALQLAQDPAELVYKVLKEAAYVPAKSLFPGWVRGAQDFLHNEYPPQSSDIDIALAREHLELAREELGLSEFPAIVILTGDSSMGLLTAEYYQELYKRNLGLEIRIDAQIFKQRLAKMTSGDFDIVMAGWGPDYDDALTFGDLFSSWNLNNRGRYSSDEMDAQVRIAQAELDPVKRAAAFGEIQRLVHDDVVIIPMYERGVSFVVDPQLVGFRRRSVGPEVDYNYVRLAPLQEP
tara:strand:+ start:4222 stop:5928 length:1707 start_codon:yes stop_codon:yes gene_type:complete